MVHVMLQKASRAWVGAAALLTLLLASPARADRTYADPAAWEAAVAGREVRDVALPATPVPRGGGTVRGVVLTLVFPANHGDVFTLPGGWGGDVHESGEPLANVVEFDEPVSAIGAVFAVAPDGEPASSSILLRFNETYRLTDSEYAVEPPRSFSWVTDERGVDRLEITSGAGRHFYLAADARFVGGANGIPVPEAGSLMAVAAAGYLCLKTRLGADQQRWVHL